MLRENAATVESVIRGLLDGAAFIRNPENKPQVVKSLANGLRLERSEDAEDRYQSVVDIYERKILSRRRRCAQYDPPPRRGQRKDPALKSEGIGGR